MLLRVLSSFPGTSERSDKPIWKIYNKGVYTVKSCYWKMNYNVSTNWKMALKTTLEGDMSIESFMFCLATNQEGMFTHEVPHKRDMQICSRFFMCEQEAEVNNHILIHCQITASLWNMFLCILGISWVMMPKTTLELLNSWPGVGSRGKKEEWWKLIPSCIWWSIWKERNTKCFEGQKIACQRIKTNCISHLFFLV